MKGEKDIAVKADMEAVEAVEPLTMKIPMGTFHDVKDYAEQWQMPFQSAFIALVDSGLKQGGAIYSEPMDLKDNQVKKVAVTVNLPLEVHDGMKYVSDMSDITMAGAAVRLIDEGLQGGRVLERVYTR